MTDAHPKKRAWLQLHLATGLLIMVAIGAFLYPNFKPQELVDINVNYGVARAFYYVKFGWPFTALDTEWDDRHELIYKAPLAEKPSEEGVRNSLIINYIFDPDLGPPKYPQNLTSILADLPSPCEIPANRWDSSGIVLNLAVLASGLAVLVIGMEWVLRRRDRRANNLGNSKSR
ncbi:MAG: hypothetical protein L6R28_09755 [Planctomycetes bacterium]|nr:hypothetical protein [Planctomycetota bacterium]